MAKKVINLNESIRLGETQDKFGDFSILKKGIDPQKFDNFIKSLGDNDPENEVTISKFFAEQEKRPIDLGDITINLSDLDSGKKLPKQIQYIITNLFIKKLQGLCRFSGEEDTFNTTFGEDFENKNIDITLLQKKLSNFENNVINQISITNNQIFDKLEISPIAKFQEQTPSNQSSICKILNREIQEILQNLEKFESKTKNEMSSIIIPNTNLVKNLEIDESSQKDIADLKAEKYGLEDKGEYEELKILDKKIREMYLQGLEKNGENQIAQILQKLLDNGFDFQALEPQEMTILAQKSISRQINENNDFANRIGLNTADYNNFLQKLYNFDHSKQKELIKIGDKTIHLEITKSFEEGKHKQFYNLENFENMESLPIKFEINLDANDQESIDILEDPQNAILSNNLNANGVIGTYTTKKGNMRLGNNYFLKISGNKYIHTDMIDRYFTTEDLGNSEVDIMSRSIILKGKDINKINQLYLLSKINSKEEVSINDEKREEKVSSVLDQKKEFNNFDRINDEGTEGKEKGEAYAEIIFDDLEDFILEPEDDEENFDPTDNQDRSNCVGRAKELYKKLNDEGKAAFKQKLYDLSADSESIDEEIIANFIDEIDPSVPATPENTEEKAETPREHRDRQREKVKGDKGCNFENGTRLYFKNLVPNDTELPPDDISDHYFVFEICNVQGEPGEGTFGLKLIGDEYESKENGGKIYDNLPMTGDQLKQMLENPIYKMPERKNKSREESLMRVNKSGIVSKMSSFGNREGQASFDGKKFIDKDGNELKYFDRVEDTYDTEAKKQGKKISKYEIKGIDKSKGTVKIASNFDGYQVDNGTSKSVKYKYENEMTFEQFIIFIETKKLKGYNEEQQKEMETKYGIEKKSELPNRGIFRMASIGNLIDIFKGSFKTIKDKMKENQEEQKEALENFMYSNEGLGLYRHLGNIFSLGGILGDVQNSFYEMELDYYNNRDSKIWKKIDKWYSKFSSDPVFAQEFMTYLVPILSKGGYIGDRKDRYKFAAAFLFMIKKEGPYTRVFKDKLGEGYWVEAFLGPGHKKRFQNFYKKKVQEINEAKDMGYPSGVRLNMMSDLNKMEVQYIICVIDGAAPYNSDDENAQKSIRGSKKFKEELQSNLDSYYGSIDSEKSSIKTFYQGEEAYIRTVGAGRFNKALPALAAMCEKASTPGEIYRLKGYLISAMLMGIIKNGSGDASTYKTFWQTARAMGFGPLFWARDPDHPEKVLNLLDGISEKDPNIQNASKALKFNLNDFTPPKIAGDYKSFTKDFWAKYWNANGKNVLKYIENPTYGGENSLKSRADAKKDKNRQLFADIVKFNNDDDAGNLNPNVNSINYVKEAPLTATGNIMKKYMPQKGEYKTEKEEDRSDAKDAWTKIGKEIAEADPNNLEYYFKYFINIFGYYVNSEELIRTISLIKWLKTNNHVEEAKYVWWFMFKGNMHIQLSGPFPEEFETCFNNFSNLFFDNVDKIDKSTIKNVFGPEVTHYFSKPYKMVNWQERSNKMGGDDSLDTKGGAFKNTIRAKGYGENDTINNQIKIKQRKLKNQGTSFERLSQHLKNSTLNVECTYHEDNGTFDIKDNQDKLDDSTKRGNKKAA